LLVGCTSLQPVELPVSELREKIVNDNLIVTGDRIEVVLDSGERKSFTVTTVTPTHIRGEHESAPIDAIVALETKEFSGGKTALLGGGAFLLYGLMAAIGASVMIGF